MERQTKWASVKMFDHVKAVKVVCELVDACRFFSLPTDKKFKRVEGKWRFLIRAR